MITIYKKIGHLLLPMMLMLVFGLSASAVQGQVVEVLKDVWPGNGSSSVYNWMAVANGKLFFCAEDDIYGWELRVSDGTDAGTILLKDINPGLSGSEAGWSGNFTECNNKLFFIAKDGIHGAELWATDGTETGTYLVKDIGIDIDPSWSGLGNYGAPEQLFTYNNKVYFAACDGRTTAGYHDTELWCSDGTEAGTYMLKDIRPDEGSQPSEYCIFNGLLYFSAYDGGQQYGAHGRELWVTDGTEAGTHLFKDIAPVASSEGPQYLTVCGEKMFFTTDDGVHGKELWVTDGTDTGTHLVKDIRTDGNGSYPTYLTVVDGILYFNARVDNANLYLWRSDGTESGTFMISPAIQDPVNLKAFDGKLYFIAANTFAGGGIGNYELYSFAEATGVQLVKEINPSPTGGIDFNPGSNFPEGFAEYNNMLYFRAADDMFGTKLWQTDGTEAGTIVTPNQDPTYPDPLTAMIIMQFTFMPYNGSLYFPGAYQDDPAVEVYKCTATPGLYQVTGSGSYCQSGAGLPVGLADSDIGVYYTLYRAGVIIANNVPGTGEALSFGNWLEGTYTIEGTNALGTVSMIGSAVIVAEDQLPVSVTLQASQTSVCTGQSVTITATPVNGGSPTYEWYLNGVATGASLPVYTFIPANGDQVYCVVTSDIECVSGNPATSNTVVMTVSSSLVASITIGQQPEGCAGQQFTVTSIPVNGGDALYEWKVNGSVATTSTLPSYTYAAANGDQVSVVMTSGLACATGSPATSNTVALVINQPVTPEVSITASQNPVPAGTTVEYTPTSINGGTPSYEWFVNGTSAGTGNTYSYIPLNDDKVKTVMTSSLECVTSSAVTSNTIFMDVITGIDYQSDNKLTAYSEGNSIFIDSPASLTGTATLIGLSGEIISKFNLNGSKHNELHTQVASGLYLLKIESDDFRSVVKVLIK